MNWYNKILIDKFVKTSTVQFFAEKLERFYELEYKYSMLKLKPFIGMERRRENIIKRLETELQNLMPQIIQPIIQTYQNWLKSHALLNPIDWAIERARGMTGDGDSDGYEEPLSEYNLDIALGEAYHYNVNVAQLASKDIEKYKNLTAIAREVAKERAEYDTQELEDIYEYEMKDMSDKQKEKFIEQKTKEYNDSAKDARIDDALEMYGNSLDNNGLKEFLKTIDLFYMDIDPQDVLVEIYLAVFDGWYSHWSAQGIDQTRRNVEIATDRLMSMDALTGPSKAIEAVTLALQTVHQSGDMIEYLEGHIDSHGFEYDGETPDEEYRPTNLKSTFNYLAGKNTSLWDEELKEIGVQI